jgi:hypothetical protein
MKSSLSLKINNSKEAKKFTYKIIKKLQLFEKHGRCIKLYNKSFDSSKEASIVICMKEMKNYVEKGLICDEELEKKHVNLNNELTSFIDVINKYSINKKKLPKGRTFKLLKKHKKLFGYNRVNKIRTVETSPDHWYNVIVAYVNIWNNRI